MKLKTLKDLTVHNGWEDYGDSSPMGFLGDIVELDELKAEAVKRWKHWNTKVNACMHEGSGEALEFYQGRCTELIEFFNITKDDLE